MKGLVTYILLFVFASALFSQSDSVNYYVAKKTTKFSVDKINTSITLGAVVSSANSYYTFIAPKIGYQLSPKFILNLGLMHYSVSGNSLFTLSYNEGLYNNRKAIVNGNLIFVEGEYLVKPHLILSGAVMVGANNFSQKQMNYKAAAFGLEYKVSKQSSIKFQTTISQGQGNYYNSPTAFPTNGFNSFGTGFSNGNSMFR